MKSCGVIIAGAIAAGLCGSAGYAQNAQSSGPNDGSPQSAPAQSTPAQAAPAQNGLSDAANTMIGTWEFSNADHDRICHFTFRADAATGGNKLDIDKNCPNLFPSTANIVGWSLDNYGDLRLLDADGKEVVELSEVEGGMYDGFTPEEGRYILQTAAAAPTLSAADMVGDWAVARGAGRPICVLTLANSPAGDAWRFRSSLAAIRSSCALRRVPGASMRALWSCYRRTDRIGNSKKTMPRLGNVCRKRPIQSC